MSEVEACDGAEAGEGREGIDEAYLTGDRTGAVDDAAVAEDEDLLIALTTLLEEEIPHASILHHQRLTARRDALDVAGEELIHRLVLDDLGPRLTLPITEVHLLQSVIEGSTQLYFALKDTVAAENHFQQAFSGLLEK